MRGHVPAPADHWTPYAQQFKADPRRTGDLLVDYLQAQVASDQVVIDVGAGGGRLALPLALACKRVVAVEPSPSMCQVLREAATEFGVGNVEVVESEWMDADVEKADVTLCSHVVYTIQDIVPFVRKLQEWAAELVIVILFQSPPQSQIYQLWETVHGEPRHPLPSLPEFRNVLTEMGVRPTVSALPAQRAPGFDTLDDAKTQLTRRLFVAPGSVQMERLESALAGLLEEQDGTYRVRGARPMIPNVVSWRPSSR
jgi:SAM-dependent methyltransferase